MSELIEAASYVRSATGWGWLRALLFVVENGVRFARVYVDAEQGIRDRALMADEGPDCN